MLSMSVMWLLLGIPRQDGSERARERERERERESLTGGVKRLTYPRFRPTSLTKETYSNTVRNYKI